MATKSKDVNNSDRFIREPGQLTTYDRAYITEYMKDWNRSRAMFRMGFKGQMTHARARGGEILGRPEVRSEINRRLELRAAHTELNAERVIRHYKEIAEANLYDAIVYDDNGDARIELGKLTRAQMAGVAAVDISKKGDLRIKMHDKLEALERLGHHLRLWRTDEKNPVASVRFIIEDSPRQRRVAAEVTVGRVLDQSEVTREIGHEGVTIEGARAP